MKVLFCAYDRAGYYATGPNAWLQRLVPDLKRTYGIDVEIAFIYRGEEADCPSISFFREQNISLHTLAYETNAFVEDQVLFLLKIIKEQQISVLAANLVIPAFYAARYLKIHGIPVIGVLHSHDIFYQEVISKFIASDKSKVLDAFVAVSDYILGLAKARNKSEIELRKIPCAPPESKSKASPPGDKLKVLYMGRLELEAKQVVKLTQAFIDAAKENEQLEFTIYGSGTEKENIIQLIQENEPVSVYYKGQLTPGEVYNVMTGHHVFTLMSDYEGMPIAVMEAMACGLVPVCLEEESGVRELINDGVNGFLVKDREQAYRDKINMLARDKELWNRMSEEALKHATENFSSGSTHQEWAELLHELDPGDIVLKGIPTSIQLKDTPFSSGEIRRPSRTKILKARAIKQWQKLKQKLRPRSRIKALFYK